MHKTRLLVLRKHMNPKYLLKSVMWEYNDHMTVLFGQQMELQLI